MQWSRQLEVFAENETGRQMGDYIVFWCETAEKFMAEGMGLREAFDDALPFTDDHLGVLDAAFLGKILAFIVGNWKHGNDLAYTLSNVELKLLTGVVQDYVAMRQMEAEQEAALSEN